MKLELSEATKDALSLLLDYAYDKMANDTSLSKGAHTDLLLAVDKIENEFEV